MMLLREGGFKHPELGQQTDKSGIQAPFRAPLRARKPPALPEGGSKNYNFSSVDRELQSTMNNQQSTRNPTSFMRGMSLS